LQEIPLLSQALAITGINIRSIPERWAPSLVIVIGLAGVVAVFTALLAMAAGFESTLQATGRTDAALILRGGSDAELNSAFDRDSTDLIKQEPGIRIGGDGGLLDAAGLAGDRYDAEPGSTYLLRPDGYVAARFRQPTQAAIAAALSRACALN